MSRRRRSYGGGGGDGLGLAAILGAATGAGEAQANPAFGAAGPGDVDFTYTGDPSEAIAKYGTTDPFKQPGFLGRLYGNPGGALNARYRLGQAGQAAELAQIPQRIELESAARLKAEQAAEQAARAQLEADLAKYFGEAGLPAISPETYRFRYGARAGQRGIPLAEAETESGVAEAKRSQVSAEQETGARERFPEDVAQGLRATFRQPIFANDAAWLANLRAMQDPSLRGIHYYDGTFLGPNLEPLGAILPGQRGGEMTGYGPDGKPIYSQAVAPRFTREIPAPSGGGRFVVPQQPREAMLNMFDRQLPSGGAIDYSLPAGPVAPVQTSAPAAPSAPVPPAAPTLPGAPQGELKPTMAPGPEMDPFAMFRPITDPLSALLKKIYNPRGYYGGF